MSERRPHWTNDLIEAVYAELPAKKYQVEPDSWEVHRIIAAVEDWARWEHVPKGTLARLEQAEAAIARVRELHHSKLDRHPQGDVQRCIACLDLWPCPTIRAIEGGSDE